ncbi:Propane 2-monooxygenase, hydroxylase component small subunit [Paraconexibacter sp. AEG42_29]|uniref:propane 2-monooxygenase n=1 Tax=Paraconexibacter sp. AEG42_29 TaxID=2997339 RepID=A0AAU7AR04_9ACTN
MTRPDVSARKETPTQPAGGSALACTDWQAFTGPGERWARSIERMEAEAEARVKAAVARVIRGETFSDVSPLWLKFLQRNLPVAAFAFNECGRLLEAVSRRTPWGGMAHGLQLQASMQYRQAQSIVLYAADMEQRMGQMPMHTARSRWETDREWLPAHHYLEQAATCTDWGETLVAVNLCFEPLAGQLLRREIAMGLGPAHGDHVTTVVAEAGQEEWALTRSWTTAVLEFFVRDATHGPANRRHLQQWIARQLPLAEAAVRTLAGLAKGLDLPRVARRTDGGPVARVIADQRTLLTDLGLVAT